MDHTRIMDDLYSQVARMVVNMEQYDPQSILKRLVREDIQRKKHQIYELNKEIRDMERLLKTMEQVAQSAIETTESPSEAAAEQDPLNKVEAESNLRRI